MFSAPTTFSQVGQVNTLQSGDVVNGEAGNDTLIAQLIGGTVAPTLNSVENVELTDLGGSTLNLSNADSVENLTVKDSVAATTVSNARNLMEVSVQNISGGNNVTVGYREDALAGETTQVLNLESLTMLAGGGDILFEDSEGAGKIEALEVNASGVVNVATIADLGGVAGTASDVLDALETVTVNAEGNTNLGTLAMSALTSFDASASTGNVAANVSAAAGNDLSVVGGEGDDFITFGAGNTLDQNDSIDLGAGNNTLAVTGDVTNAGLDIQNVQTLRVTTNGDGSLNTVNAANVGAGVETYGVISANNGDSTTISNAADDVTVNASDALGAVDTLNALTVGLANTSAADNTVNLGLSSTDEGTTSTPNTFTITTVNVNGVENLNIDSTGAENTNNTITTLNANAQETVTITGDRALTIGSQVNASTVNAAANTAGVTLALGGTAVAGGVQNVVGSEGDDTLSIDSANLDADDTSIDAGEGEDTLVLTDAGGATFTTANQVAPLAALSNFENLSFAAGQTLTISDAFLNVFTGDTVNVVAQEGTASGGDTTLNASAVVTSNATINVDASDAVAGTAATNNGFNFNINNGTSSFVGTQNSDTVTVSVGSYLDGSDSLNGGAAADTLAFDVDADTVIQASQLSGVSSFETVSINADGNEFEMTIDNAFASSNANTGTSRLAVDASGANNADEITIDASDVSGSTGIDFTADDGATTDVTLGAGNDVATLGAGTDTVTLGGGENTVEFLAAAADNTITDFDFGTATGSGANVDTLDISAFNLTNAADGGVELASTGTFDTDGAGGDDTAVVVLNAQAYADAAAAEDALTTFATASTDSVAVLWQDTLGNVQLSIDTNAGTDGSGFGSIATLEGVTIQGVAQSIDSGDFTFA